MLNSIKGVKNRGMINIEIFFWMTRNDDSFIIIYLLFYYHSLVYCMAKYFKILIGYLNFFSAF